ncbi:hypothetical protein ALC57_03109 [Trachymyrmex cornetzi]|uniref:Uncharacterized protein n=1 Tax=Trachymyrmex cornetzi TaxID=471704 RepID=A0A151JMH6_9HYME|nr:hypothetical protein ALC57_03109 [Trachymyrmex cornetzi]
MSAAGVIELHQTTAHMTAVEYVDILEIVRERDFQQTNIRPLRSYRTTVLFTMLM